MTSSFAGSASDVVSEGLSGYVGFLVNSGFADETRRQHLSALRGFREWLATNEYESIELCQANAEYLRSRTDVAESAHDRLRYSLNRFLLYLRDLGWAPPPEESVFAVLEADFGGWLRRVRDSARSTVKLRLSYLRRFQAWCFEQGVNSMSALNRELIEDFFIASGKLGFSQDFKRSLRTSVRLFLCFCHEQGHCRRDLSGAVPSLRCYRLAHVPRAVSEDDAQALMKGIDRESISGIRDYAIMRLLYEYGVRAIQVRSLRLTDIDWRAGEIFFAAVKGAKSCRFPLTTHVGNALLAYLQVRPRFAFAEVFLTLRAPYGPLAESSTVSGIVRRRFTQLGIDSPVVGAHGFRHAFAKRLLQQQTPFKHLADLMGHRHLQTTFIYTKIDFFELAGVALELPEVDA